MRTAHAFSFEVKKNFVETKWNWNKITNNKVWKDSERSEKKRRRIANKRCDVNQKRHQLSYFDLANWTVLHKWITIVLCVRNAHGQSMDEKINWKLLLFDLFCWRLSLLWFSVNVLIIGNSTCLNLTVEKATCLALLDHQLEKSNGKWNFSFLFFIVTGLLFFPFAFARQNTSVKYPDIYHFT